MTSTPSAPFWDNIDAILIINLKHRTDRWDRLHQILSDIGVADKIHRIEAVDGKTLKGYKEKPWFKNTPENVARMKAGSAGCCLSHRKAIAYAKEQNFNCILLMEDDALFKNDLNGFEGDTLAKVLQDNTIWDMFYLGFYQKLNKHHVSVQETINGKPFELWRVRGPLMLHAVVINSRIFDEMLDRLPTESAIWSWMTYWGSIDAWIQNKFGRDSKIKIWATMPKLVVQIANYSDICGRMLTVAESEGSHRKSTLIPLELPAFERTLNLQSHERIYQLLKRGSRVLRARLFGYKKT